MPRSEITEMFSVYVDESEANIQGTIPPIEDGPAEWASFEVFFLDRGRGTIPNSNLQAFSEVLVFRRSVREWGPSDWDRARFNREDAILVTPVTSNPMLIDMRTAGNDAVIYNQEADFVVAITTSSRAQNNDQFSIVLSNVFLSHFYPDPYLDKEATTKLITCVDSAGDLMPERDFITAAGSMDRKYKFFPPNYPDFAGQRHADGLDSLEDLEIPQVLPSECTPTAVIGIEMAARRDRLRRVFLNFVSSMDGANSDNDYWLDDPVLPGDTLHHFGVYDPHFDEIIQDNDNNGIFTPADTVLYPGANGRLDSKMTLFDDDMDGLVDEEELNGINDDHDYWADENANSLYDPGVDEHYFDYDRDGLYSDATVLDERLDTDGTVTAGAGTMLDSIAIGAALTPFQQADKVGYTVRDGNVFDENVDIVIFDMDGDGKYTFKPDRFVDSDGNDSIKPGERNVPNGSPATAFRILDNVFADNLDDPIYVWLEVDYDDTYTSADSPILGRPAAGVTVSGFNVADATWAFWDQN
ncbi:MAG TPA: hypothetical protein PKH07_15650, partial [bacterium]|nr:hypothetical protein [bacterium]